jgi:hypothetical protein
VASRVLAKTELQLKQDLRNLIIVILKGRAPEEVQERPAAIACNAEANIPCLGRELLLGACWRSCCCTAGAAGREEAPYHLRVLALPES